MPRRWLGTGLAILALGVAGCQVQEEVVMPGDRELSSGLPAGESEPAADERRAGPAGIPPGSSSRIMAPREGEAPIRLVVRAVAAERGEDGRGATVEARAPVALELHAEGWPGRAADPVLRVGPLVFRDYQHPEPGVLRFVAADGGALPAGAEVVLQYGDDASTRVVVARALEAPR